MAFLVAFRNNLPDKIRVGIFGMKHNAHNLLVLVGNFALLNGFVKDKADFV